MVISEFNFLSGTSFREMLPAAGNFFPLKILKYHFEKRYRRTKHGKNGYREDIGSAPS